MTDNSGGFIWYELMTPDPDAAARFYGDVVGWRIGPAPSAGQDYRMIGRSDGGNAGGVLKLTPEMTANGMAPLWVGYLQVNDVDASIAAIEKDGGGARMPATDLPVGRIAMVSDPQGALLYIMRPIPPEGQPDAKSDVFSVDRAQHVRWNELQTTDPEGAVSFYSRHFGWSQQGDMDMGPMGRYRFIQHDGVGIGAIMPKMPQAPRPVWSFYFGVDDIDRAAAAVSAGGGALNGPINQIPGGEYSVHCSDPQGAAFGLVGPRRP